MACLSRGPCRTPPSLPGPLRHIRHVTFKAMCGWMSRKCELPSQPIDFAAGWSRGADFVAGRIVDLGQLGPVVSTTLRSPAAVRLECLVLVFVEVDAPGGEFDEPEHGFAVRCRAFDHAVGDGVVHGTLLSGRQVTAVQQLGQHGQAVIIGDLATHSDSLCASSRADGFVTVTLLPRVC